MAPKATNQTATTTTATCPCGKTTNGWGPFCDQCEEDSHLAACRDEELANGWAGDREYALDRQLHASFGSSF